MSDLRPPVRAADQILRSFAAALCGLIAGALALSLHAQDGPGRASSIDEFRWDLPRGFPSPLVPADNPMSMAKIDLGRRLFHERRLSITGAYACASCHEARFAFTDQRAQALGATAAVHSRSAMSLANVAYNASFGWVDPRIDSLEKQVLQPLMNQHPVEMGLQGREAETLQELKADPQYPTQFAQAFPQDRDPLSLANLARAIASYERTLISGRSAFDRRVFDDDSGAMNAAQKRGMGLFFSERIGCSNCHFGINFSGPLRTQTTPTVKASYANTGLYNIDGHGAYPEDAAGLAVATGHGRDQGRFRVPTLRNIAVTAPYMHDGSIATLEQVIDHYAQGGRQSPRGPSRHNRHKDPRLKGFAISAAEKSDLIAFLESLTDPAFLQEPLVDLH